MSALSTHNFVSTLHTLLTISHNMDSLQYLAIRCYMENCKIGTRVPHDIPGSTRSWVTAWMESLGINDDEDVLEFVVGCLIHGKATRLRAFYPFRKRLEILCDTIGINRGPHKRSNLSDVVIMLDKGFSWKKKKVTRTIIEEWEMYRTIEPEEIEEMEEC